jgi:demethylmenaquinone methyltransferase/2-methoxy-6-polyprenyl-1,4-benzoquinol methylase
MAARFSTLRDADALRRIYTALAPTYDALVPFVSRQARAAGLDWLGVRDGEDVLDVGTGTGLALTRLAAVNPTGWTEGVDMTPAMLARAERRMADGPHDRYGLRHGRATALPYPADAFDAVFSSYLVDVLPTTQLRPALREMRRVLRPSGRLVLVYLAPPRRLSERLWAGCTRWLIPLFGGGRPINVQPSLSACTFEVQARTRCRQAGLRSGIVRATPR